MADRTGNLLAEVNTTLDGNGDYTGTWLDVDGVLKVRVLYNSADAAGLQQSNDKTNVISTATVASNGDVALTARYCRFVLDAPIGQANAAFYLAMRAVA